MGRRREARERRRAAAQSLAAFAAAGIASGVLVRALRGSSSRPRRSLGARARYVRGKARGVAYRATGGHPDALVPDDVLADRIRSTLGPIERRLDIPHLRVMVHGGVALLHGAVGGLEDAQVIHDAVRRIPGVRAIDDRLHVGLVPGVDTRPSEGRASAPESRALARLLDAVTAAGRLERDHARRALEAALTTFMRILPSGEREHVGAHLPSDVRTILGRVDGKRSERVRTVERLVRLVQDAAGLPDGAVAGRVVSAVLATLRDLIPEERGDVEAVLPAELRRLWVSAPVP